MNGVERSNDGVVLKKCPFCGGEVKIDEEQVDVHRYSYFFICDKCEMVAFNNCLVEKEEAIKAWNNRKPLERVIERLETEMKLAEKDMRECTFRGMPFYDEANGYATAMYNAIEIIKEEMM